MSNIKLPDNHPLMQKQNEVKPIRPELPHIGMTRTRWKFLWKRVVCVDKSYWLRFAKVTERLDPVGPLASFEFRHARMPRWVIIAVDGDMTMFELGRQRVNEIWGDKP